MCHFSNLLLKILRYRCVYNFAQYSFRNKRNKKCTKLVFQYVIDYQHHNSVSSGGGCQFHHRRHIFCSSRPLAPFRANILADQTGPRHSRDVRLGRSFSHLYTGQPTFHFLASCDDVFLIFDVVIIEVTCMFGAIDAKTRLNLHPFCHGIAVLRSHLFAIGLLGLGACVSVIS